MENIEGLSGDWIGNYYHDESEVRHVQELNLQFSGNQISGRGIDDVGVFTLAGSITGQACEWVKSYSSHRVHYTGALSAGNKISGSWTIHFSTGTFSLWPRGKGGPGNAIERPNALDMQPTQPLIHLVKK